MPDHTAPFSPDLPALLKGVSRSFYLSIRLLPAGLRRPVAIAYLLARTSDTLADAPGIAAQDRIAALDLFMASIQGTAPPRPFDAGSDATPAERRLLAAFPTCMRELEHIPAVDRGEVFTVLGHIVAGQRLDIERFGVAGTQAQALTPDELDQYTYLVAGSVGEFWTRLGFRHVDNFASLPQGEMCELGRRYGMALQLVNVLRDRGEDLANGRAYVHGDDAPWFERASAGLDCARRYCMAVGNARVRVASALPAILGARTLTLLREAGPAALSHRVKVPRGAVRAIALRLALTLGGRAQLEREFRAALCDNRAQ